LIEAIEGRRPELGSIDVSMHRDDLSIRNTLTSVRETRLPLNLEELTVVLVDDVLFTGRTCRAAMDAITSFGRPARIQLAVLLDRGHRELPIRPDYVGKNLPTSREERVRVRLQNVDTEPDSVRVEKP
jgi:pyrimidine operon attenuation protein/uracil phosphoribosyltransferase